MVPSHAALDTRWCQDMHGLLLHRDRRTVALDPPGLAPEGRSAHWARSRGRRCTFVGLVRQRVVGRVELLSYSCKLSSSHRLFSVCTLHMPHGTLYLFAYGPTHPRGRTGTRPRSHLHILERRGTHTAPGSREGGAGRRGRAGPLSLLSDSLPITEDNEAVNPFRDALPQLRWHA